MRRRALLAGLLVMAAGPADPAAPIAALNAGLLAGMKAGKATPFSKRAASLGPVVDAAFDLKAILAASIGPRFASIAPDRQAALFDAFRTFTVATWVANFDTDGGERFEVASGTRKVGNDEVVTTRIVPASGDPVRLDYVMRRGDAGWKAVDILVDGSISRVAVQRSDFRALLKDADPTALIANLRDKAVELAGGKT